METNNQESNTKLTQELIIDITKEDLYAQAKERGLFMNEVPANQEHHTILMIGFFNKEEEAAFLTISADTGKIYAINKTNKCILQSYLTKEEDDDTDELVIKKLNWSL